METNLHDKMPRLQFRMIDVVGARKLVWEAVVIIEFNAHAYGATEVAWMKQLSKYNGTYVHGFNKDTEKRSLNACRTKTQLCSHVSNLLTDYVKLEN